VVVVHALHLVVDQVDLADAQADLVVVAKVAVKVVALVVARHAVNTVVIVLNLAHLLAKKLVLNHVADLVANRLAITLAVHHVANTVVIARNLVHLLVVKVVQAVLVATILAVIHLTLHNHVKLVLNHVADLAIERHAVNTVVIVLNHVHHLVMKVADLVAALVVQQDLTILIALAILAIAASIVVLVEADQANQLADRSVNLIEIKTNFLKN
jgi:hypothetical protein